MKTTDKYSHKRYQCVHCGTEGLVGTNHYGEVYSSCSNWSCVSRRPVINATLPRHVCLEELPEGMGRPEPWKTVKLGDIVEIKVL